MHYFQLLRICTCVAINQIHLSKEAKVCYYCGGQLLKHFNFEFVREAPSSSSEHQGITVWAMVLGRELNSRVCLKTRWIKWTTWWQKRTKIIKTAKRGKSHQKNILKNFEFVWLNSISFEISTLWFLAFSWFNSKMIESYEVHISNPYRWDSITNNLSL